MSVRPGAPERVVDVVVGVGRLELLVPGSRSLKDKRQVIKSLSQRIAHRFNVSISEVEHHDLWQRATLAVAHVSNRRIDVEKVLFRVSTFAETAGDAELVRATYSFYDPDKDTD